MPAERTALCHSSHPCPRPQTLLFTCRVQDLPAEHIALSPCGDCFVKAVAQKGILPEILEELLAARKRCEWQGERGRGAGRA